MGQAQGQMPGRRRSRCGGGVGRKGTPRAAAAGPAASASCQQLWGAMGRSGWRAKAGSSLGHNPQQSQDPRMWQALCGCSACGWLARRRPAMPALTRLHVDALHLAIALKEALHVALAGVVLKVATEHLRGGAAAAHEQRGTHRSMVARMSGVLLAGRRPTGPRMASESGTVHAKRSSTGAGPGDKAWRLP
jgi:hypothetical protein